MLRTDLTSHKVVSLNEWLEARKAKPGGFAGANEQGRDRSEQRRKTASAKKKFKTVDATTARRCLRSAVLEDQAKLY